VLPTTNQPPRAQVASGGARPPVPGGPDWEGEAPAEPAPGWSELMQRCWAQEPEARPAFPQVVGELEAMLGAARAAKRRAAAAAAAAAASVATN
jgi:hypothetical protein